MEPHFPPGETGRHPLAGKWAPNLTLRLEDSTTHVAQLMCAGRGVLVDLAERSELRKAANKWGGRVEVTSARCYERPANLDVMLVRPDGYVAWALGSSDGDDNPREPCGPLWRNGSVPPD